MFPPGGAQGCPPNRERNGEVWSWMQCRRWAVVGLTAVAVGVLAGTPAGSTGWRNDTAQPPPETTGEVRTVVLRPAADDAFDWVDAGIGGAVALGLALVAAGAWVVLLRRPRQRVPLVPPTARKEQHP